jgi:hypothetical protein
MNLGQSDKKGSGCANDHGTVVFRVSHLQKVIIVAGIPHNVSSVAENTRKSDKPNTNYFLTTQQQL